MPLPNPKKDEKQKDFVGRCMGDKTMNSDFPKQAQRYAVCLSQWKESKKKKKSKGLNEDPTWEEWRATHITDKTIILD